MIQATVSITNGEDSAGDNNRCGKLYRKRKAKKTLDAPARIINERTMLPVRAVSGRRSAKRFTGIRELL